MKELWIDIFPYWKPRNSLLVAFLVSLKLHRLYMQLMKKKYLLCWCIIYMGKNIIYFSYSSSAFFWWRYIMHINYSKLVQINCGEEKLLQNSDEGVLIQWSGKFLFEEILYLKVLENHSSDLHLPFSSSYRRTKIQRG